MPEQQAQTEKDLAEQPAKAQGKDQVHTLSHTHTHTHIHTHTHTLHTHTKDEEEVMVGFSDDDNSDCSCVLGTYYSDDCSGVGRRHYCPG